MWEGPFQWDSSLRVEGVIVWYRSVYGYNQGTGKEKRWKPFQRVKIEKVGKAGWQMNMPSIACTRFSSLCFTYCFLPGPTACLVHYPCNPTLAGKQEENDIQIWTVIQLLWFIWGITKCPIVPAIMSRPGNVKPNISVFICKSPILGGRGRTGVEKTIVYYDRWHNGFQYRCHGNTECLNFGRVSGPWTMIMEDSTEEGDILAKTWRTHRCSAAGQIWWVNSMYREGQCKEEQ
jgi:hypothetical protein